MRRSCINRELNLNINLCLFWGGGGGGEEGLIKERVFAIEIWRIIFGNTGELSEVYNVQLSVYSLPHPTLIILAHPSPSLDSTLEIFCGKRSTFFNVKVKMKYNAAHLIKAYTIRVAKMSTIAIPAPMNTISSKENGNEYHESFSMALVSTGFLTFYTKETNNNT